MNSSSELRAEPLDTTARIETPEHIVFQYQLAGPARRALAYAIDFAVRAALVASIGLIGFIAEAFNRQTVSGFKTGMLLLVVFLVEWGYFVACESLMGGRSIGKRAAGLRVVTHEGHPIRFGDSVLRNLLRAADFLPSLYVLGLITMALDARFRRLGDFAAGTMVVLEERHKLREAARLHPPPTDAELHALPARIELSNDAVEALELFLRRSQELPPLREQELAELLAPTYAQKLGVRYQDPARFLGLLYHRASGGERRAG